VGKTKLSNISERSATERLVRNISKLTIGPTRLCSALLLALIIALTSAVGRAQPYRFDLIARTGGGFGQLGVPTLNAGGEVAFFAVESDPNFPNRQSIYTGTAGHNPTLITRQGDRPILGNPAAFDSFGQRPSISNSGFVAFLAQLDNGHGAVFLSGVIVITDGPPPLVFRELRFNPLVNTDNYVAFSGRLQRPPALTSRLAVFVPEGAVSSFQSPLPARLSRTSWQRLYAERDEFG
jgi:hypothetical protein